MSTEHSILVYVDAEDEDQTAVRRAAEFAKGLGAPLVLVSTIYDPYVAGKRFRDAESLREMRESLLRHEVNGLEAVAGPYREQGLSVATRAVWDTPRHEALVRQVVALDAQMLVVPAHEHHLLERTLFGNEDWQLLRTVPCPLLLTKKTGYGDTPKIFAAVDPLHQNDKPAELDDRLIYWGQRLRECLHGEFHLLHVVDNIDAISSFATTGMMPMALGDRGLQKELETAHRKRLAELAGEYAIPPGQVHQFTGYPPLVLAEQAADNDVDLMIMGAVSRGRIRQAIIGNTAEKALEEIPCDLLVIKPHWFENKVEMHTGIETMTGD